MAVGSDHTPFHVESRRVVRLYRELQLSGIDPLLPSTREGDLAFGVALSVDAAATLASDNATVQFVQQAYDILATGLPLSVTALQLGTDQEAMDRVGSLCDSLRVATDRAAVHPTQIETVFEAKSLTPQEAWLCRKHHLGDGPLYLLLDDSVSQRDCDKRFWLQLWHLRMISSLQVACAPMVVSSCPLLSAEAAFGILPGIGLQVPAGSAWLPLQLDISRFANCNGVLQEEQLEQSLRRCVDLGDELHRLVVWPTAQARHDAWLNRRLAIIVTGLGDLLDRRGLDPGCFKALQSLSDVMHSVMGMLHRQSREVALRRECLPALLQTDPSREMSCGVARNSWHQRWSKAVESAATGHRNLLVMPLWTVFPRDRPADFRYSDLLPVLGIANACACPSAPDLSHWTVSQFKSFYQRAWAVLQQRDAAHQIAERI
jgi:hypothetical protein